jgi:hypothetical protein
MTLLSRVSVLAVKVEATPGTAEALTGTEAAYNFMDAEMNGDITVSTRPIQGSFRKLPGVPGARGAECTFSLELTGDGAGGVPGWATVLLAGCGVVNTTGTLTPRSEAPGTNVKTLTLGLYENGRRKIMSGAVGNVQFVITPGQSIMMNFTFRGKWGGVSDIALLTPTYPTSAPIRASNTSGGFTVNSVAQTFGSATFDVGNQIEVRPSVSDPTGFAHAIITDRTPTWSIDPEARLVGGGDVFGDWIAGTTRALSFIALDSTDKVTFAAPAVQKTTIGNGDRNGLRLDTQTLLCCRDGANPEFSIVFGAP